MRLLWESAFFSLTFILSTSEAAVSGSVTETCSQLELKPAGPCSDEDKCPYQINLPPLNIQLPKQFHLLEETMKELESLKETVRQLKSACLGCSLQKDGAKDAMEERGDGDMSGFPKISSNDVIQEMQTKMANMSGSLKDAHDQIEELQDRLDAQNKQNLKDVEHMVNKKVENITGVINKFKSNCSHSCAQVQEPAGQSGIKTTTDCSDLSAGGIRKSGVYRITPSPRNDTFEVYCDLETAGGGWTVVQNRFNGSVSFNRTWAEYKRGFGEVHGEHWLGNDHIHLLTRARTMTLRIELEDLDGVREFARYDKFYVANEFLKYRLSLSGYSGTAGNAFYGTKDFSHDQKFFTTWDRDHDLYAAGNCGAYYGAGWWFNACMSANLNGKYYHRKYKGKRDGIFWATWHRSSEDNYLTSLRQAFKSVRMMIRPENYAP